LKRLATIVNTLDVLVTEHSYWTFWEIMMSLSVHCSNL